MKKGTIVSINISRKKGTIKEPVPEAELVLGQGLAGDAHFGFGHRQVSLMMLESIEAQAKLIRERGSGKCPADGRERLTLGPGVYAENLTTQGLDLSGVKIGDLFRLGRGPALRVTQIGKECHTRCQIYTQVGDCIMPRQGIFCEVLEPGRVRVGDAIEKN